MKKRVSEPHGFPVLSPNLQISFALRIAEIRQLMLGEALKHAVERLDLEQLDRDLKRIVPKEALKRVAAEGLRGETVFPTPSILEASPFLLGYYRLLYGFSQKEFYSAKNYSRFKSFEERGLVPMKRQSELDEFCSALAQTATALIRGMAVISIELIHELQMLTFGAQLRGGENNRIGGSAATSIRGLFESILGDSIINSTPTTIQFTNAAKRTCSVAFGRDPDVKITEMTGTSIRYMLSIEIKGGSDRSNIHNRLGEAEKSHLKAKQLGCNELWTILKVDLPESNARKASPTTTRFYWFDDILGGNRQQQREFIEHLIGALGLPDRND